MEINGQIAQPTVSETATSINPADKRRTSSWDLRNAPKNYIWLILFQAGSSLFAFGAVWLITRRNGSEGYGAVFAVIAASQIAQIFTNWTTVAVVKYGVEEFVETAAIARTFWSRFIILISNFVLMLAIVRVWMPPLAEHLRLGADTLWLVVAHFLITAIWLHVQMGLQAAKMLREQGFLQMIERLMIVLGIAGLIGFGTLGVQSAVICYIAAAAVMTVAGTFLLRRFIFCRFSIDKEIFRKTIVYSLPLLPYWIVGYLSGNYIDAVFISSYLSHAELGVYAVATQVNGIALQVPTLANTILLPLLLTLEVETGKERSWRYFRNILPVVVLGWGALITLAAFVGALLIPLVFGQKFEGAVMPMWILLSGSIFWIPVAVGYAALANARAATYMSLAASGVAAAINLGANYYLIPRFGMVGCAWATLLAYAGCVVIFAILLRRVEGMPVSWTFLAFLPATIGAGLMGLWDMPLSALAACLVVSVVIGVLKIESVKDTLTFIYGLRRTVVGTD